MNIRTDLTIRVCIITAVFSIISYVLIQRNKGVQDFPVLFILFGVVILISIIYDIQRFHAIDPKPTTETKV
jgi:hypothetical protein